MDFRKPNFQVLLRKWTIFLLVSKYGELLNEMQSAKRPWNEQWTWDHSTDFKQTLQNPEMTKSPNIVVSYILYFKPVLSQGTETYHKEQKHAPCHDSATFQICYFVIWAWIIQNYIYACVTIRKFRLNLLYNELLQLQILHLGREQIRFLVE